MLMQSLLQVGRPSPLENIVLQYNVIPHFCSAQYFVMHRIKLTDVIIWEMHGFPHTFPALRENATKPMV